MKPIGKKMFIVFGKKGFFKLLEKYKSKDIYNQRSEYAIIMMARIPCRVFDYLE